MIKLNKVSSAMENGKFSRVLSKTVYTSTLACMMAIPVMAQENDTAPAVDDATEVIEVKGIR